MKILAFEFSSSQRSVAVAQATGSATAETIEVVETGPGATRPIGMIDEALHQAHLEREQIEILAIGLGPGSYTGIRTAIALAQGWQLACEIQIAGVSSAECIAAQASTEGLTGRVLVVIDAQRQEFYRAAYDLSSMGYRELEPLCLASRAEVEARSAAGELLIGPDLATGFPQSRAIFPRAATVARLALKQAQFVPGQKLEPIYLRETAFVKAPPPRQLS